MKTYNWGIIAPGHIATKFAEALNGVKHARLYAVASRDSQRAKAFADRYGFQKVADDYTALINDPDVDAIYIASPHRFHAEQSIECLKAGKAVLCEKPMTVNADEAEHVINTAKENKVFYLEAVWTRFMPLHQRLRELIDEGAIGTVEMVQASFGFSKEFDPAHRLYDANLAGGALLDLGIYPITMAQMAIRDTPSAISALAHIGDSGVDERTGVLLQYPQGQIATLNTTLKANTTCDAWIFGSEGSIHIPYFWFAESATLYKHEGIVPDAGETIHRPHRINGYEGEIEEVQRCLEAGLTESPLLPWKESLAVTKVMDEARRQIGLKYPFEP